MHSTYTPSGSKRIQPTLQFLGGYIQKCDHRPGRTAETFSYGFLAKLLHKTLHSLLAGFTLEHVSGGLLTAGPPNALLLLKMDASQVASN